MISVMDVGVVGFSVGGPSFLKYIFRVCGRIGLTHPCVRAAGPPIGVQDCSTAMDRGNVGFASSQGCDLVEQYRSNCRGTLTCRAIL